MKARRRGRPKLPRASAKQETIAVRLRKAKRKAVEGAASRAGLHLSDWVRGAILGATAKSGMKKGQNCSPLMPKTAINSTAGFFQEKCKFNQPFQEP